MRNSLKAVLFGAFSVMFSAGLHAETHQHGDMNTASDASVQQVIKGTEQIAQEGAIQIFRDLGAGMEEVIVGVVGVLQLEVLEYRLKNEYNVDIRMQTLPYEHLRWVLNDPEELDIKHLDVTSDTRAIEDMKGNPLLLFGSPWSINWAEQHNPDLKLSEFGNLTF